MKFSDLMKPEENNRTKKGVIEFYRDNQNEFRWRIVSASPKKDIIADSGEGYINKADCLNGLDSVRWNIKNAEVKILW